VVQIRELLRGREIAESGQEARGEDSAMSGQEGVSGDWHDRAESQHCTRWAVGGYGNIGKNVGVIDKARLEIAQAMLRNSCKDWAQAGTVGVPLHHKKSLASTATFVLCSDMREVHTYSPPAPHAPHALSILGGVERRGQSRASLQRRYDSCSPHDSLPVTRPTLPVRPLLVPATYRNILHAALSRKPNMPKSSIGTKKRNASQKPTSKGSGDFKVSLLSALSALCSLCSHGCLFCLLCAVFACT
jgi:hypothetical protein